VLSLTAAGCGAKTPDYQSIWTSGSSTTAAATTTSTQPPVPLGQYLENLGVTGEPVVPADLKDLTVTVPRPRGWSKYSNANFMPQAELIAKNDSYPTATLMVFRLHGNFDVGEVIQHATADALLSPDFRKLNESFADFDGFPSAMIEGSYTGPANLRLHSYNRVVIPVTPAPAFVRYLVQFTVTSRADQAVSESDDIQAVIDGFTVAVH